MHSLLALFVSTYYSDSVIDLIFLNMSCAQVIYYIEPYFKRPSDHALLIVDLSITPKYIQMHRKILKQDSEEEVTFLLSVSERLFQLNFSALDSIAGLDLLSKMISGLFANCWATYAKRITVTTHSKKWWNNECRDTLEIYRQTGE